MQIARPIVVVAVAVSDAAVEYSEIDGYDDDGNDDSCSGDSVRRSSQAASSLRVRHGFVTCRHYIHTRHMLAIARFSLIILEGGG